MGANGQGLRSTVVIGGALALALGAAGVGFSQSGGGKITADSGRGSRIAATKISRTIAGPKSIKSSAFAARPPYGKVAARSTKKLAGFPRSGKSYMILSNGDATRADNPNNSPSTSSVAGGPAIRGNRDVTIFRVNIRVPEGRNCLSFRFRFLTEEFPEFVGTEFNDGFIAELDESTWDSRAVGDPKINAPRNFANDSDGNLITVNGAGAANTTAARAKGTTYDGATRVLRASTRVTPGGHVLYFSIFDQGDRQFDSSVFIDRLRFAKRSNCDSGAVPDQS